MNKTKILTSLSALAAVFVFNVDAFAGTATPTCDPNDYSFDFSKDTTISSEWQTSCGAQPYVLNCQYGATGATQCVLPAASCVQREGFTLKAWDIYANADISGTALETVSAGAVVPNSFLGEYADDYKFYAKANFDAHVFSLKFICTASGNVAETAVTESDVSITGDESVDLKTKCQVPGYTVTWVVKRGGAAVSTGAITDGVFTPAKLNLSPSDLLADATFVATATYTPKTYNVTIKGNGGTDFALKYTNPVSKTEDPVWKKSDGTTVTTATLAARTGYKLRAVTGTVVADVSQDATTSIASNIKVPIASSGSSSTATLPDLGVITSAQTWNAAWAKSCVDSESATCTLAITPTTGVVRYTNACKAGFH